MPTASLGEILDGVILDREVRGLPSLQNAVAAAPHLLKILGDVPADDLTRDDILRVWRERRKVAAPNTVIRDLGVLRRAYSLAMERGVLERMPAFPRLGEDRKAIRKGFLTERQVAAICEHLPEDHADLVGFLYASAWRKSEATGLLWADVGPDAIRITATKEGHTRVLPMAGEISEIIRRRADKAKRGDAHVFVFAGAPIGDFRKRWKTALRKAGVFPAIIHDLRRSALKRMVEKGVPAVQARQFSGHRTNATFERYAIQDLSGLRAAAELVASSGGRKGRDLKGFSNHRAVKAGDRDRTGDLNLGKVANALPFRRVSRW